MISFVIFSVSEQMYGLDIESVKRILPYQKLTDVANEPDYIDGMFQYEEKVINVLSFRKMIGQEPYPGDVYEQRCLVLIDKSNKLFGVNIDQVDDIIHIDESRLHLSEQNHNIGGFMNIEAILENDGKLITIVKDIKRKL